MTIMERECPRCGSKDLESWFEASERDLREIELKPLADDLLLGMYCSRCNICKHQFCNQVIIEGYANGKIIGRDPRSPNDKTTMETT